MRIYTRGGDLAFSSFVFPDGQPHFKLETYEREFNEVTIETSIKDPGSLLCTLLASNVLRHAGYSEVNLDIRYLMSARMDRAIDWAQPFTLGVVAGILNSAGFSRVRILDAHSEVALRLIRNSSNVLPEAIVRQVRASIGYIHVIAIPDKGAVGRVHTLCPAGPHLYCEKARDMQTGALTGFKVKDYSGWFSDKVLIVDDICDGGGTFTGLAKELRKMGAGWVGLFVTHGIFSKAMPLEGIDKIFTTDSYYSLASDSEVVVIPVNMEKLK